MLGEEEAVFFSGVATGSLTLPLWVAHTRVHIGSANWIQWVVRKEERERGETDRDSETEREREKERERERRAGSGGTGLKSQHYKERQTDRCLGLSSQPNSTVHLLSSGPLRDLISKN